MNTIYIERLVVPSAKSMVTTASLILSLSEARAETFPVD